MDNHAPAQGPLIMWWPFHRPALAHVQRLDAQLEAERAKTREAKGVLAQNVVAFGAERHRLEKLMQEMIAETRPPDDD